MRQCATRSERAAQECLRGKLPREREVDDSNFIFKKIRMNPLTATASSSSNRTPVPADVHSVFLSPRELADTKQALRALALQNMDRTDNQREVRAQMYPLITKLAAHFGDQPAKRKLPLVVGAWRQLWSDYPYPKTPFVRMDPSQIYQVVSPNGHYWNIGDELAGGLIGLTGVLRGAFESSGNRLRIRFTKVGFRLGRLRRTDDLLKFANALESGRLFYAPVPGGGVAPHGPINIRGTLETIYVDSDLRIERGTQDDYIKNGQVLVKGHGPKLFVLDRAFFPTK